ncbi:NDR1/HIN1-like protein 12 [Cicer arietinum]|uniref:NDR1/HIN1-like protein 12 n=1 Tax=Cicer arietinum TaxID=3827 RepID=A0A1S2YT54_CICAR|nr:NDR1/HIN1-like protein 12 [Cicer arietinum]
MAVFKRKLVMGSGAHTNPLIWIAAIICTIFAISMIIAGIVIFIGYIVIHPRVPIISVTNAHLDLLKNDYAGLLQTQLTIVVTAYNGNAKAHATFSEITFSLGFQGQGIAVLVADSFDVSKNGTKDLSYVVQSYSIPLTPYQIEVVDECWKRNEIGFDFKGAARTRWKVGPFGSVKYSCHLNCELKFHPLNGSYVPSKCSSKSR